MKQIIIFICVLGYTIIYADNSVGNLGILPLPSQRQNNNYSVITTKLLSIKYTVFDYQMSVNDFSKFLKGYNLEHSMIKSNIKNILFTSILDNQELGLLTEKLTKNFINKSSGATRCIVENNLLCGSFSSITNVPKAFNASETNYSFVAVDSGVGRSDGSSKERKMPIINKSSILYRTYTNNKNISVRVTSDFTIYKEGAPQSLPFQSEVLLDNVLKNKNYIFISQFPNSGLLIGQIILVSFQ